MACTFLWFIKIVHWHVILRALARPAPTSPTPSLLPDQLSLHHHYAPTRRNIDSCQSLEQKRRESETVFITNKGLQEMTNPPFEVDYHPIHAQPYLPFTLSLTPTANRTRVCTPNRSCRWLTTPSLPSMRKRINSLEFWKRHLRNNLLWISVGVEYDIHRHKHGL